MPIDVDAMREDHLGTQKALRSEPADGRVARPPQDVVKFPDLLGAMSGETDLQPMRRVFTPMEEGARRIEHLVQHQHAANTAVIGAVVSRNEALRGRESGETCLLIPEPAKPS